MYVTVTGAGKARVVQFVEQHRIPKTKKKKTVVIETLGNYEKMLAQDPDIIEKLKLEAKRRTEEKKLAKQPITLKVKKEAIEENHPSHTNFHLGHSVIRRVWQDLALDKFFNQKLDGRYPKKVQKAIFSLVMHRMMNPSSIRASHLGLSRYAGIQSYHKDLYYQLLDTLDELTESLIDHLCQQFQSKTHR